MLRRYVAKYVRSSRVFEQLAVLSDLPQANGALGAAGAVGAAGAAGAGSTTAALWSETEAAIVCMVDITAYSNLTGILAQRLGRFGSEVISSTVGKYLGQIIDLIDGAKGDVVKFLGDAMLVKFSVAEIMRMSGNVPSGPDVIPPAALKHVIDCCLDILSLYHEYLANFQNVVINAPNGKVKAGDLKDLDGYKLALHISMSAGTIQNVIIGNASQRMDYVIAGAPIAEMGTLLKAAGGGELSLPTRLWTLFETEYPVFIRGRVRHLDDGDLTVISKLSGQVTFNPGYTMPTTRLGRRSSLAPLPNTVIKRHSQQMGEDLFQSFTPEAQACFRKFMNTSLLYKLDHFKGDSRDELSNEFEELSEYRRMSILFLKLKFAFDSGTAQKCLEICLNCFQNYDGVFQQFSVDDKGTTLLGVFGLPPHTHENETEFSLKCALEIEAQLKSTKLTPFAISLSTGETLFSVLGNQARSEAGLLSDVVVLAARLMELDVAHNCIVCDEATKKLADKAGADEDCFPSLGSYQLKGRAEDVAVYRVAKMSKKVDGGQKARLEDRAEIIGYKEQREELTSKIKSWMESPGEDGIVAVIEGPSGIGKTYLAHHLQEFCRTLQIPICFASGMEIEQATPWFSFQGIVTQLISIISKHPATFGVPIDSSFLKSLRHSSEGASILKKVNLFQPRKSSVPTLPEGGIHTTISDRRASMASSQSSASRRLLQIPYRLGGYPTIMTIHSEASVNDIAGSSVSMNQPFRGSRLIHTQTMNASGAPELSTSSMGSGESAGKSGVLPVVKTPISPVVQAGQRGSFDSMLGMRRGSGDEFMRKGSGDGVARSNTRALFPSPLRQKQVDLDKGATPPFAPVQVMVDNEPPAAPSSRVRYSDPPVPTFVSGKRNTSMDSARARVDSERNRTDSASEEQYNVSGNRLSATTSLPTYPGYRQSLPTSTLSGGSTNGLLAPMSLLDPQMGSLTIRGSSTSVNLNLSPNPGSVMSLPNSVRSALTGGGSMLSIINGPADSMTDAVTAIMTKLGEAENLPLLNFLPWACFEETESTRILSPVVRSSMIRMLIVRLITKVCQRIKIAIMLDNAQWMDQASLEALNGLLKPGMRPVILIFSRPVADSLVSPAKRILDTGSAIDFKLEGFTEKDVEEMIKEVYGPLIKTVDPAIVKKVFKKCGGHPYFSVQLIKAMKELGKDYITMDSGRRLSLQRDDFNLDELLGGDVQTGIMTQFDKLSMTFQRILKAASVMGQYFDLEDLVMVMSEGFELTIEEIEQSIKTDDTQGFLTATSSDDSGSSTDLQGSHGYGFKNVLVLNTIAQSMSMLQRQALHGRIAQHFEGSLTEDNMTVLLPTISYHYSQSANLSKSVDYLEVLAAFQIDRYLHAEGIKTIESLIQIICTSGDRELREKFPGGPPSAHRRAWWYILLAEAQNNLTLHADALSNLRLALRMVGERWPSTAPSVHTALWREVLMYSVNARQALMGRFHSKQARIADRERIVARTVRAIADTLLWSGSTEEAEFAIYYMLNLSIRLHSIEDLVESLFKLADYSQKRCRKLRSKRSFRAGMRLKMCMPEFDMLPVLNHVASVLYHTGHLQECLEYCKQNFDGSLDLTAPPRIELAGVYSVVLLQVGRLEASREVFLSFAGEVMEGSNERAKALLCCNVLQSSALLSQIPTIGDSPRDFLADFGEEVAKTSRSGYEFAVVVSIMIHYLHHQDWGRSVELLEKSAKLAIPPTPGMLETFMVAALYLSLFLIRELDSKEEALRANAVVRRCMESWGVGMHKSLRKKINRLFPIAGRLVGAILLAAAGDFKRAAKKLQAKHYKTSRKLFDRPMLMALHDAVMIRLFVEGEGRATDLLSRSAFWREVIARHHSAASSLGCVALQVEATREDGPDC
ncbi:hypothetical protein HK101_008856 [Irineochytrium annulatum]|nr:hypothetical protein HK101_008856 [Irineochytrium annulatum]